MLSHDVSFFQIVGGATTIAKFFIMLEALSISIRGYQAWNLKKVGMYLRIDSGQ